MLETLRERLNFAVLAAGCSARELDRLAGLTPGHSWLLAEGKKLNAKGYTLAALAVVLGISLDWLMLKRGDPPSLAQIQASVQQAMRHPEAVLLEIEQALGVTRPRTKRTARTAPTPARRAKRSGAPPAPSPIRRAKPVARRSTKQLDEQPRKPRARKRAPSPPVEATPS